MKEKCSEEMNWFRVILKCVRVNRVQENKFHHIYRFLPNGNLKNFNHYSRFVLITKHEGIQVKDFFLGYEFKRATSSICYESTLSSVTRYLNIIAYHRWHFTLLHTSSSSSSSPFKPTATLSPYSSPSAMVRWLILHILSISSLMLLESLATTNNTVSWVSCWNLPASR